MFKKTFSNRDLDCFLDLDIQSPFLSLGLQCDQQKVQNISSSQNVNIRDGFQDQVNFSGNKYDENEHFLDQLIGKQNSINDQIFKRVRKGSQKQCKAGAPQMASPQSSVKHGNQLNVRSQKNRMYTKNYREKKKEELKSLQQQNTFLKQKIQDLSFRLKQAQMEINRLKHSDLSPGNNFNQIKQKCLKQIENVLSKQTTSLEEAMTMQKKMKNILCFSNKPRLDLLNYFMNQLMQNLITDQGLYFVHSLEKKIGIWRQSDKVPLKKLDLQISQILKIPLQTPNNKNHLQKLFPQCIIVELLKIKTLWKKLYSDYIKIINHGMRMETMCRSIFDDRKNYESILSSLRMRLHFEKIKYRKDIREIRQSWFRQIHQEQNGDKQQKLIEQNKKCKVQS